MCGRGDGGNHLISPSLSFALSPCSSLSCVVALDPGLPIFPTPPPAGNTATSRVGGPPTKIKRGPGKQKQAARQEHEGKKKNEGASVGGGGETH